MSRAMDTVTGFQLTVSVNGNGLICHRLKSGQTASCMIAN